MNTDNLSGLLQEADPQEEIKALKEALAEKSIEIDRLKDENRENEVEIALYKTVLIVVTAVCLTSLILSFLNR